MPFCPFPEMMFRSAAFVPPICVPPQSVPMMTPSYRLLTPKAPVASVPIKFPAAVLSWHPLSKLIPRPLFPEHTLALIVLLDAFHSEMPVSFGIAALPDAFTPQKFPSITLWYAPTFANLIPEELWPDITLRPPGTAPPIRLLGDITSTPPEPLPAALAPDGLTPMKFPSTMLSDVPGERSIP